jgi:hypothetical protein
MLGTGDVFALILLLAMVPAMAVVSDVNGNAGAAASRLGTAQHRAWASKMSKEQAPLKTPQELLAESKAVARFKKVYEREKAWVEAKSHLPCQQCPNDKRIRHVPNPPFRALHICALYYMWPLCRPLSMHCPRAFNACNPEPVFVLFFLTRLCYFTERCLKPAIGTSNRL